MAEALELDIEFARRLFPDSAWAWAFFENAGGSFVPQSVIDRLGAYMAETQVQPGASFPASATAARRMAEGQRRIAEMINADADEIIIGPSTTANIYVLAKALRAGFDDGDDIIVTNLDHEANNGAWRRLAETGITVNEWKVDPETAELDLAGLEELLGERTRLVSVSHCSNIVGTFNDVAAIARLAHAAGALVCVDGVAYAPHRSIDVKALDVDFYALSPYKLYGPHLGVLYGKRRHLLEARGQNHYFIGEDEVSLKFNPGGPNHELTAALVGTADYFEALHSHHFEDRANSFHERVAAVYGLFAAHEERLAAPFVEFLSKKSGVRLIGRPTANPAERAPTFSFVVEGRRSADIPPLVEPAKVAIRNGHFYAHRLISDLGIEPDDGVVRVSMAHYNTAQEVERLITALDGVL